MRGKPLRKWSRATLYLPYVFFMTALALYCALILLAPLLASQQSPLAPLLYDFFAAQCHQLTARSLCLYVDGGYRVADCMPQNGTLNYSKQIEVWNELGHGFKFGMCARDTAIFFGMLVGGLAAPFVVGARGTRWPNKWLLVAAMVPIAVDGVTQLLGLRESTNALRLLTGGLIGVVMPLYIIPILNQIWQSILETRLAF
ncbi:MAG: DUF2085 domain-containing protein [Candidatus Micrarchaeia archaeon]